MRLKIPERFHRTLAFRLTFWYSAIFILGFLILSVISYFFVFASIRGNRPERTSRRSLSRVEV